MTSCWIVTDGKPGTENQCLGVAEALGLPRPVVKRVGLRQPWRTLSPWIGGECAAIFTGDLPVPPWPDLLIASGRKSIAAVRYVKKQNPGTFAVQLQDPRASYGIFDLIAVPRHDRRKPAGNILEVIGAPHRVTAERLAEVEDSLPPGIVATSVLNRSELVNSTIATVARNLTEGALLVVLVLFLLLGNIRAATITALMIPLSFLFAVIGMNRFGISGNLMSLGALDFGLMVDGGVVVIENTLLLLTQRRAQLGRLLTRHERLDVAVQSARQMVKPAAFGQLIILLVFAPLLMLEGVEGKTFQPMGATVMLALVGAFIFSFTFVPAMTALLVRDPKSVHVGPDGEVVEHETRILRFARRYIQPAIQAAVARPKVVLISALAALAFGAVSFMALGREFIPTLDEGDIAMQALRVPSASLEQSLAMQMVLERAITAQPEVETMFSRTGTAEAAVDPMPPNISDSVIVLKDRSEWPDPGLEKEALIERIEEIAGQQIGNNFEFSQPIELRFNELISGVRTDLAVMVYGDDFASNGGILVAGGLVMWLDQAWPDLVVGMLVAAIAVKGGIEILRSASDEGKDGSP